MTTKVIDITPKFTDEQSKEIENTLERKNHLEYLCFMMLRELDKKCSLERLFTLGIKNGMVDANAVQEFFGDRDSEESGCLEAEGHTIPSLLKEWCDTTEKMVSLMRHK